MAKISTIETMGLDGGNPSLDFVNSGYGAVPGELVERLHNYGDVLTLAGRQGIIDEQSSEVLAGEAHLDLRAAAQALEELKKVRKVLYSIFSTLATSGSGKLDQSALDTFNKYLGETLSHRKVSVKGLRPIRDWNTEQGDLQQLLRYYVLFAYEVLTGSQHLFIKQCTGCAWLFLDESKNHRRKWCDMAICGSSEKAKRYYRKRKQLGQHQ